MDEKTYLEVKQIAESVNYPFSLGTMRHYLMMRHYNGLNKAIRKIGRRVYLRKDLFDQWIESHQPQEGEDEALKDPLKKEN